MPNVEGRMEERTPIPQEMWDEYFSASLGGLDVHRLCAALAARTREVEAMREDAERWRAFARAASLCTEGISWNKGGYWLSGPVVDEPRAPREHMPTPGEYGDAVIRWVEEVMPDHTVAGQAAPSTEV